MTNNEANGPGATTSAAPTDANAREAYRQGLLGRQAQREAARAERARELEIGMLEAVEKLEGDGLRKSIDFEVVDLRDLEEGFIVLKLREPVYQKAFETAVTKATNAKRDIEDADVDAYVTPSIVVPDVATYRAIVSRRKAIAARCANALATLNGVRREDSAGKY